jgi:hypothetical protein
LSTRRSAPDCSDVGVEIAQELLLQTKTAGTRLAEASHPPWKAPVEVAPSPKKQSTQVARPSQAPCHPRRVRDVAADRHAIDAIRHSRGFHQPPGARATRRHLEAGIPLISPIADSR